MKGPRTVLVTFFSRTREADAVADADVPLRELLTSLQDVLCLSPDETAVTLAPAGDLACARACTGGAATDRTLAELGVLDGDVVVFHPPGGDAGEGGWR